MTTTLAETAADATPALDVLWETAPPASAVRGVPMPPELRRRYGGDLVIPLRPDRPTVVADFVSTIDGVVALGSGELSGGGWVSGFHEPDRFVMAILRAVADVVVIGAGTLRGSTSHRWTAEHVQPRLAGVLADWRRAMGLAPHPTTVVVTGSGEIPTSHAGLNDPNVPVIIATTPLGADRLRHRGGLPGNVAVESTGKGAPLMGEDILGIVTRLGARVVLSEGGPHVLAGLVGADLLDELFLTLAPQVVGRLGDERIGLVEGIALAPADARWHELASVRRSEHHLFLRYRRAGRRRIEKES